MKHRLVLMLALAATSICTLAQTKSEIKITTSKEYGDTFDMWPKTTSIDVPVVVDWGDGELKSYNIDPNDSGFFSKVSGKITGDTIRIFSELTQLDCSEANVTSLFIYNQPLLTQLMAGKNELTTNCFDFSGAKNLENIDVHQNNITLMDMREFTKLQYFTAYENEGLTTVLFADGCETLQQISISNCDISNFYPISLPNLTSLEISNNALMEIELGENYPKLGDLEIEGNYLQQIDLSKCPELTQLGIGSNMLSELNVVHNTKLLGLFCSNNQIEELDLSNNKELTNLSCANNKITNLDLSNQSKLLNLTCNGNQIRRIDVSANEYLQRIYCSNNLLEFLDFSNNSRLKYVDCRNNPGMTACSVNYMFSTMWALQEEQYYANLLIEGCNAEGADASEITSSDYKWKTDITCDASAVCDSVVITMTPAENGEYHLEQPSEAGQKYVEVTTKAMAGTPVKVVAAPEKDFALRSINVNGTIIEDSIFCPKEDFTISVDFASTIVPYIAMTTENNTEMTFELAAAKEGTAIDIDWGNGNTKQYVIGSKLTRIDGISAGTDVKIYGEITAADLASYPGIGMWDNKISSLDISHNDNIVWLSTYMNPIGQLDVSNCAGLEYLDCAYSELETLDITSAPELKTLICYGNSLSALDVSKADKLDLLNAKANNLQEIDLANNSLLKQLDLQNNNISAIEVAHMADLEKLLLSGNTIESIDLSQNTKLKELAISANRLNELNLENNTLLSRLQCASNQIESLDLSANELIEFVDCESNSMTACALNDLYYSLPEFYTETPQEGFTLLVKGMDENMNDADHAESLIAKGKGWKINYEGDGSGCDEAYITILDTENGTVELTGENNETILSGQKVKKNTTVTVHATPDKGYMTQSVKANGKDVENGTFTVTRATDISVKFVLEKGVKDSEDKFVTVSGADGHIYIKSDKPADIYIYTASGTTVYHGTDITQDTVKASNGIYIIKIKCGEKEFSHKLFLR